MMPALRCPVTGGPLTAERPGSLRAGAERWPVAAGIAYLRPGRDELRFRALARSDAGDADGALAVLLTDQDPFAPLPPPSEAACRELIAVARAGTGSLRDAMRTLHFGLVGDYFLLRPSTPTFLSGLGLLAASGRPAAVVEVACGVGHFLRELVACDVPCLGVDLVFAKLWLARMFVVPGVPLVCGDAAMLPLAGGAGVTLFCHDAFYFLPDKPRAVAEFARVAGPAGQVVVGHAHNRLSDHSQAGSPLTPGEYAGLFPGAAIYDDAALTAAALTDCPPATQSVADLAGCDAISLIHGDGGTAWWGAIGAAPPGPLVLNPLLTDRGGRLEPAWPDPRFAAEYAGADYLAEPVPPPAVLAAAARGERPPAVEVLARRRVLVPAGRAS